jgi:hypothetical protein
MVSFMDILYRAAAPSNNPPQRMGARVARPSTAGPRRGCPPGPRRS